MLLRYMGRGHMCQERRKIDFGILSTTTARLAKQSVCYPGAFPRAYSSHSEQRKERVPAASKKLDGQAGPSSVSLPGQSRSCPLLSAAEQKEGKERPECRKGSCEGRQSGDAKNMVCPVWLMMLWIKHGSLRRLSKKAVLLNKKSSEFAARKRKQSNVFNVVLVEP